MLLHKLFRNMRMADQQLKMEKIRTIENLQLPVAWIDALNDAAQAEDILTMLRALECVHEQWN